MMEANKKIKIKVLEDFHPRKGQVIEVTEAAAKGLLRRKDSYILAKETPTKGEAQNGN
jgi:hypothetical protein